MAEFRAFPVASTNIFPLTNSAAGGQLLTEFNVRSRESIGTDESVTYMIGPSYTHSMLDFMLNPDGDAEINPDADTSKSCIHDSVLVLSGGRAIVNGHFLELLTDRIRIDIQEKNAQLNADNRAVLKGKLAVGIRAFYTADSATAMAGSMRAENTEDMMYDGLQIVILPVWESSNNNGRTIEYFNLPEDVPNQEELVTAHLRLGTFRFENGQILDIEQDYTKTHILSASRLKDIDKFIDQKYLTKTGLQKGELYVFAQKDDESANKDTWCIANDALMVWDANPTRSSNYGGSTPYIINYQSAVQSSDGKSFIIPRSSTGAKFITEGKDNVYLHIPHKQVDNIEDEYIPINLKLPVADYDNGTPGIVNNTYTKVIKDMKSDLMNKIFTIPNGKYGGYMSSIDNKSELPKIVDDSGRYWESGTYVIVGSDNSLGYGSAPVTMYIVQPGKVKDIMAIDDAADAIRQSGIVQSLKVDMEAKATAVTSSRSALETYITNAANIAKARNTIQILRDGLEGAGAVYVVLTTVPSDWSTNWTNYYKKQNGIFVKLTDASAPTFVSGMYYSLNTTALPVDSDSVVNSSIREIMLDIAAVRTNVQSAKQHVDTLLQSGSGDVSKIESEKGNIKTANDDIYTQTTKTSGDYGSKGVVAMGSYIESQVTQVRDKLRNYSGFSTAASDWVDRQIDNPYLVPLQDAGGITQISLGGTIKADSTAIKGYINSMTTDLSSLRAALNALSSSEDNHYNLADIKAALDTLYNDTTNISTYVSKILDDINAQYDLVITDFFTERAKYEGYYVDWRLAEARYTTACIQLEEYLGTLMYQTEVGDWHCLGRELAHVTTTDNPGDHPTTEWAKNQLDFSNKNYYGCKYKDYFTITYSYDSGGTTRTIDYIYVVYDEGARDYSDAIVLTKQISLAEDEVVGGFYNISDIDDHLDNGYVYLDETGHLRLMDYSLLRTGVAAYQLGQDITIDAGLTAEEVQIYLDDYVNDRIAFPNNYQKTNEATKDNPYIINLTIGLSEPEGLSTPQSIYIRNVDSRFNTVLKVHITGTATSNTHIYFQNCQKLMIDPNIGGQVNSQPHIHVVDSCLYYDCDIMERLTTPYGVDASTRLVIYPVVSGLSFWYEKYEDTDPNLIVDHMTIIDQEAYKQPNTNNILDRWTQTTVSGDSSPTNDYHYTYALRSLTYGSDGTIIGAEILIKDDNTLNVSDEDTIIMAPVALPQGSSLSYPTSALRKPVSISGRYISAYDLDNGRFRLSISDFTFTSQHMEYDGGYAGNDPDSTLVSGDISLLVKGMTVNSNTSLYSGHTGSWTRGTFHVFSGGIVT